LAIKRREPPPTKQGELKNKKTEKAQKKKQHTEKDGPQLKNAPEADEWGRETLGSVNRKEEKGKPWKETLGHEKE